MTPKEMGTGGQPPEPFATHALKYWEAGLCVIPCGGDDGKKALIKWKPLQGKKPSERTITQWMDKHPTANIAIVTGSVSGITVVDCDNPNITPSQLFKTYGNTPLTVQSPSGCYHLYYRYNGEASSNDRENKIEIKSDSNLVVAPPSYNRETGEVYSFISGDMWELDTLPTMTTQAPKKALHSQGERNNALFHYLLSQARTCPNLALLEGLAHDYNSSKCDPPLKDAEVMGTVQSVWGYKLKGTLPNEGEQYIRLDTSKIESIKFKHPNAVSLYLDLLSCHNVGDRFALSPKGYNKRCGWNARTIANARDVLLEHEIIQCIYKGGRGKHDPSLYCFF